MPRLFVAIDLPAVVTAQLVAIQPPPTPGVRLVEAGQMHVTLNYIGDADIERTAVRLASLAATTFSLKVEGAGQFPSLGGAVTLWAGVRKNPELLNLHVAIAI